MFRDFEAVIFDMDGTLIDSMHIWPDLDRDFFKMHGMEYPENYPELIEGLSIYETALVTIKEYNLDYTVDSLIELWNNMAASLYENEVPYKEGALSFLKFLKKEGKALGIATSNSKELVEMVNKRLHFMDYIDVCVTSKEVPKGKPAPDIYLEVAKKLNVAPEKCLVFEDVPAGIISAKDAGMKVCGIYDEFSSRWTDRVKELSDYYILSYKDLNY